MPFTNLQTATGEVSTRAALEAIAIIEILYGNDRGRIETILDLCGGGAVEAYAWSAHSWPPSYSVLRQGQDWYVFLSGTMALEQMVGHILGSAPALYPLSQDYDATLVHILWYIQAARLATEIGAVIRARGEPVDSIRFAGHSWGGAVAFLLANQSAAELGDAYVECVTFGAPKALTGGYTGPRPEVLHRYVDTNDMVTNLPPKNPTVLLARLPIIGPVVGALLNYTHYGLRVELTPQSLALVGNQDDQEPFRSPNDLTRTIGFEHSSSTYRRRLDAFLDSLNDHSVARTAATLAEQIVRRDPPQTPRTKLDLQDYLGPWFNVPAGYYEGDPARPDDPTALAPLRSVSITATVLPDSLSPPSALLAANADQSATISTGVSSMPSGSGLWRIAMIVNNGEHGDSLSIVYKGSTSLDDAITVGKLLASKRSALLGNSDVTSPSIAKGKGSPTLEFLRVSDAVNPRISQLVTLKDFSQAKGPRNDLGAADVFSTAITFRMVGQTAGPAPATSVSSHQLVGNPDVVVAAGVYDPTATLNARAGEWDDRLKVFLDYLTPPIAVFGFMGKSRAERVKDVENIALNTANQWVMTIPAHGYLTNDRVRITDCSIPGFRGNHKIKKLSDDTFAIDKAPPLNTPVPLTAKCYRYQLASGVKVEEFYAFQKPDNGWASPFGVKVSKKNLAREILGVSFRRKAR